MQRPLVVSKFGQSAGGSAGCLCAKNTSRGLGWRPRIQSRQDRGAQGGRASGSLAKHLQVFPKSLGIYTDTHAHGHMSKCPRCMCMPSLFSRVQLHATLWTGAHQAPLSVGFSRQEYWSGLLCPPPGNLPNPGMESVSYVSCFGRQDL